MTKSIGFALTSLALLGCLIGSAVYADDSDTKDYPTKVVMNKAMKGPLLKKVASGKASAEESKELLAMMVALRDNGPKRGEMDSWVEKTTALVDASQAAVDGNASAAAMLRKASDCKACHTPHK